LIFLSVTFGYLKKKGDAQNWNTKSSKQYQFLLDDLNSVDRSVTPWLVVCLHAPWYNTNAAHQREDEEVELRSLMEDLVHEYKVDLMYAGHVHAYERTHPVFKNLVTKGATTYLNVGDGGNREGPASTWVFLFLVCPFQMLIL
jgi:Icc-related predicted phosphoesterase